MNVLVVGGAGYIGSHMVKYLGGKGCSVTVLDNLSSGHRDAVLHGTLREGDLADCELLERLFDNQSFDVVMHFASSILVGESVTDPSKYYRNNVTNTQNLLDAMVKHGVNHFIFSSTAAIFGEPEYTPIDEQHPKQPINPYGRSKWMVEQILEDYDRAYGLKSICLRYFNAAGTDPECELGERHDPETHLIPLLLQAASGKRDAITVFGRDYNTEDGTCVRDYIHVNDLCDAHWLAIQDLKNTGESQRFNLGNGNGFSVQQVINVCREVTGRSIHVIEGDRRGGDPAVLVADSSRAQSELGWTPTFDDLNSIVSHAWSWEQKLERIKAESYEKKGGLIESDPISLSSIDVNPLGQTGFRFDFDGVIVYIDPYLSNYLGGKEGEEFERLVKVPVQPQDVIDADWVLLTHSHLDHCDPKTLMPLSNASPMCKFMGPKEVCSQLTKFGIDAARIVMAEEMLVNIGGELDVQAVPAAHPQVERDEQGCMRCIGYLINFKGRNIYHSGDTSVDDELIDVLKKNGGVDTAFISINERNYYRDAKGIIGNMSVRDAFQFAVDIQAKIVVPMHWDMFCLNSVFPEEIEFLYKKMDMKFTLMFNPVKI